MKNTDSCLLLTSLRVCLVKAGCFGIVPDDKWEDVQITWTGVHGPPHVRSMDQVHGVVHSHSFTFNALIVIHKYIYSHSTTEFTFKKYIHSHLLVYFLFTNICSHLRDVFIHIQHVIFIHIHYRNNRSAFSAHHQVLAPALQFLNAT